MRFYDFDKIFISPQIKRGMIIGMKHAIYNWPCELSKNLTQSKNFLELPHSDQTITAKNSLTNEI